MPNPGDIYYALDTNKTYVTVNGQWVLQSPEFTGDVNIAQSTTTTTLASVNAAPGTYGSATSIPVITVDAKGRVTSAYSTPISPAAPQAGGPTNSIQYNSGGYLDGSTTLTYDSINDVMYLANAYITGTLAFANRTPTFNNLTPQTTVGDLIAFNGTDAVRLPVGTNGQVLTADSTEPTGLKWTTITGGSGTNVPYYVPPATTYLLPEYYQANFILPIEVDGDIEIDGYLIELSNQ